MITSEKLNLTYLFYGIVIKSHGIYAKLNLVYNMCLLRVSCYTYYYYSKNLTMMGNIAQKIASCLPIPDSFQTSRETVLEGSQPFVPSSADKLFLPRNEWERRRYNQPVYSILDTSTSSRLSQSVRTSLWKPTSQGVVHYPGIMKKIVYISHSLQKASLNSLI